MTTDHASNPAGHAAVVVIGRFQLLHNAQLQLVQRALELAPKVLVVVGSARQAPSPRNPFTWQERADVISACFAQSDRQRLVFLPVHDFWDSARWVQEVRQLVGAHAGGGPRARIALVGHRKDATSGYLNEFAGWELVDVGRRGQVSASDLRHALFAAAQTAGGNTADGPCQGPGAAMAAIAPHVPAATVQFLQAWCQLPLYRQLSAEWAQIEAERRAWAGSPYPPVFVTVDAVVRMADHVLLIRRGRAPGKGLLALPGGFLEQRETVLQSAIRELREETSFPLLDTQLLDALAGVRVFDHPDRSQRGRVITHAHYFAFGGTPDKLPMVRAADDAAEARWVPISELAALREHFHDDHWHILDSFIQ